MVGLDETGKEITGLKVQPNPFIEDTQLLLQLSQAGQVSVSFYDLSGKLLEEYVFNGNEGLNQYRINTAEWPEGLVQARVISGNQVLHSRLVHVTK